MSTRSHLWKPLGLGLFILWQLLYLAVANTLETLEVVTHRFPETSAAITKVLNESRDGVDPRPLGALSSLIFVVDKYGQLSEQPQRWSLFAPNISDQSCFLAYELRWNDREESVWLLSDDEPKDASAYLRVLGNRMRSLEQNLTLTFAFDAGETQQQASERWASEIRDKLTRDFDILIAWSRLRVQQFQSDYRNAVPPDEVIIHVRGYEIPAPNADQTMNSGVPYCMPMARWKPAAQYPLDVLPIKAFDPVTERFVYQPWTKEEQ